MPTPDKEPLKRRIRAAGLRATNARVATLELLRDATSPLTHADVAKHLAQIGANQATAFRILNALNEAGIVHRTELGDHVWRFELITEGEHKHKTHPHFLCVDCGSVSCLSETKFTATSLKSAGNIREVTEVLLRGHCHECD
jgi:Fur family transcriptional regulator, ferric uptake regulator